MTTKKVNRTGRGNISENPPTTPPKPTPSIPKADKEAQTTEVLSSPQAVVIISKDGEPLLAPAPPDPLLFVPPSKAEEDFEGKEKSEELLGGSDPRPPVEGEGDDEPKEKSDELLGKASLWQQLHGFIFCLTSAICIALTSYLAYVLTNDKDFPSPALIGVFRSAHLVLVCLAGISFWQLVLREDVLKNVCPPRKNWLAITLVFVRGFTGSAGMLLILFSLRYITPGETTTVVYCNPVLVIFFARVLFKEPLGIFRCCTALVSIVGVVVIARPPFLVGSELKSASHYLGIGLAFGAALSVTVNVLLLRVLRGIHFFLPTLSLSLIGLVICLGLAAYLDDFELPAIQSSEVYLLLLGCTSAAVTGILLQTISLKYLPASMFSVVRSSEVVFSFMFQLISGKTPDMLQFIGASLVMFSVLFIGFQKYLMELEPTNKVRIKLGFLLL